MHIDLVTKEDLRIFKAELIHELSMLLNKSESKEKKWLRSSEVRKILSISPGTLQNLRINGSLQYSKIGGIMYYEAQEISKLLEQK